MLQMIIQSKRAHHGSLLRFSYASQKLTTKHALKTVIHPSKTRFVLNDIDSNFVFVTEDYCYPLPYLRRLLSLAMWLRRLANDQHLWSIAVVNETEKEMKHSCFLSFCDWLYSYTIIELILNLDSRVLSIDVFAIVCILHTHI